MRRYNDKRAGMTVEKEEPKKQTEKPVKSERNPQQSSRVDAQRMLDTMVSYQLGMFTNNPNKNGGAECMFCGEKTSYDNRHVCVECWKKYKDEIIDGLKNMVSDVEISIE